MIGAVKRRWVRVAAAVLIAIGGALVVGGCNQNHEGPTVQDFAREREAAKQRAARGRAGKGKKAEQVAAATAPEVTPEPVLGQGNVDEGYSYDPTGKRDPFRSFMWERPDRLAAEGAGPLEQFDLSQLKVVAVVWRTGNARALVTDPSGESYIIGEGTPIGKNQGHVVSIGDNTVVVKETYVDYLGQETTQDVEMRMRRNEGG